jgi:hypothetical protein
VALRVYTAHPSDHFALRVSFEPRGAAAAPSWTILSACRTIAAPGRRASVETARALTLARVATAAHVRRSDMVVVPALDADVLEHLSRNRDLIAIARGAADAKCVHRFRRGDHADPRNCTEVRP